MKLKMLLAVATLGLPTLAGLAVAGPALADCPANTFCLYQDAGYKGQEFKGAPGYGCAQLSAGIDNDANAMRNYRNEKYRMWDFPGCVGSLTYTVNPLSYDSDFGNNGFTNKASSVARI